MKFALSLAFFAACLLAFASPPPAVAGTATGNLNINVTVDSACQISTNAVNFPVYAPLGANLATPADAAGAVILTCTIGTGGTLQLSAGNNAVDTQARLSNAAASFLNYSLFQDSARTTPWNQSTTVTVTPATNGNARAYTVYGRIPAGQNVASGAYTDVVVATLNF